MDVVLLELCYFYFYTSLELVQIRLERI